MINNNKHAVGEGALLPLFLPGSTSQDCGCSETPKSDMSSTKGGGEFDASHDLAAD